MTDEQKGEENTAKETFIAYARGAAGGMLIGMPAFMTMEIWWGGFTMSQ